MTVLSLCDYSGVWSQPYADAGYDVRRFDLKNGDDIRLLEAIKHPVRGVLAAPPCDHLANSGARWWAEKGEAALLEALALVDACCRIVLTHRPAWWALENPRGRLSRFLGRPRMKFNPCDYGDPYTKETWLWGDFNPPPKRPVEPTDGSRMHRISPSPRRKEIRSETPAGFARAFFESNP